MAYFPFNFLETEDVMGGGESFAVITGLTGKTEAGCPMPDFPIEQELIDLTQIQKYDVPNLEKRVALGHTLPISYILNYPSLDDDELSYLRTFYVNHRGRWTSFTFVDPEEYTFNASVSTTYTMRFNNNFKSVRYNKNFYSVTLELIQVF